MRKLPAAGILLLLNPMLFAETLYLCTADKVVDMGKKGGEPLKDGDHLAVEWVLDVRSRNPSLRQLAGNGDVALIDCERTGDGPTIICDDGMAGDFVLSMHTLRFIRTDMAVNAGQKDLMTLGRCRPMGRAR